MRELVFALEFRGTAGPLAGSPTKRRATSSAPSQALTTVLGVDGIRARVQEVAGERALLESRVERFEDGSFVEDGTITYGGAGAVSFVTVGRGTVAPSPISNRSEATPHAMPNIVRNDRSLLAPIERNT